MGDPADSPAGNTLPSTGREPGAPREIPNSRGVSVHRLRPTPRESSHLTLSTHYWACDEGEVSECRADRRQPLCQHCCSPERSLRECDVWWGLPLGCSARRTTMYLRLTRARFDPALADQVVPLASEVRAAMRRLPGLQNNNQGIDRA